LTFKQLTKVCDQSSSRYALGCILLERCADGSAVAVATDGRRLTAYKWTEPEAHPLAPAGVVPSPEFSVLVSAEAVRQVCAWKLDRKAIKRRPELGFVFIDENGPIIPAAKGAPEDAPIERRLPIRATDGAAEFSIADARGMGRFPKWRDVFAYSDVADGTAITLDPRFLAELCDVARVLATSDDSRGVTLFIKDPERACTLQVAHPDGRICSSVLMPLAADNGPDGAARFWRHDMRQNPTMADRVRQELARLELAEPAAVVEAVADDCRAVTVYCADADTFGRYDGAKLVADLRGMFKYPGAAEFTRRTKGAKLAELAPPIVAEPAAVEVSEPAAEPGLIFEHATTGAIVGRDAA